MITSNVIGILKNFMICMSRSHTYNRHFRLFIACGYSQVVNTDKATYHSNQIKSNQTKPNQTKPNQNRLPDEREQ